MKHIISLLLSVFILSFNALAEISPSKVFIVANSDDADSLAIAEFYAAARGVPKGNIISLPMPNNGKISRSEYFEKILRDLR